MIANLDHERLLLASALLDDGRTMQAMLGGGVTRRSFHDSRNQIVFDTLSEMVAAGMATTDDVLYAELIAKQRFEAAGGHAYIVGLTSAAPTSLNAKYYLERVLRLAVARDAVRIAQRIAERVEQEAEATEPLAELIAGGARDLLSIAAGSDADGEESWDELVERATIELEQKILGEQRRELMPFPWPICNQRFGEMERQQLVVIAGRSSSGKSSLARPILAHLANQGRRCYYVTLEVAPHKVPLQIAASLAGVGLRRVYAEHPASQAEIRKALVELRGRHVTVSSRDSSLARIEARARALHAGGGLDVLFVDHGGLFKEIYEAKGSSEKVNACGMVTKTLKRIARELDILVVMLWQLNRESAKDGNREPNVTDLKDSGSVEEDADKVILIHRPNEDAITGQQQRDTDFEADRPRFFTNVIQAKGRDDGTAAQSFYFTRATATFNPATR
jgi:replicative DNA helicase